MTQPFYNQEKIAFKGSRILTEFKAEREAARELAKEVKTGNNRDLLDAIFGMGGTKSGANVNLKTAFQVAAVYRCIALKAEGLATVPWKLHKTVGQNKEEAKEEDLYWLLAHAPSEFQTSFEFREQISMHLDLCNEAFVFMNVGYGGKIYELLPYAPNVITKVINSDTGRIDKYKIRLHNGKTIEVPKKNMWHIRGKTWDGQDPIEVIKVAREAIGLALATEEHTSRMFKNGARLGGILSTKESLDKDQVKDLRESWQLTQGGTENAYKTAVLYGGLEFKNIGFSAVDSQLNETRKTQIEAICQFFGVLPIMLGVSDKTTTYASAEAMFTAHVQYTLIPLYTRIEQSANAALLGLKRLKEGFYNKFHATALVRGSIKDRGLFYTQMYNIGAFNPNEIRAFEDMNPYEGGEKYRVPLNMTDPNAEPSDKPDDDDKPKEE